jgi:hypothetical protein
MYKKEIFAFGTAGRGALCVFIFFRPLAVSRSFFPYSVDFYWWTRISMMSTARLFQLVLALPSSGGASNHFFQVAVTRTTQRSKSAFTDLLMRISFLKIWFEFLYSFYVYSIFSRELITITLVDKRLLI